MSLLLLPSNTQPTLGGKEDTIEVSDEGTKVVENMAMVKALDSYTAIRYKIIENIYC